MTPAARVAPSGETYSEIRTKIERLPRAPSPSQRDVEWLDDQAILGVSRDEDGHVEIFVSGARLDCQFENVRGNLVHDRWNGSNGQVVANRLLLPPEPHFDPVAAFLCIQLLDNGVLVDRKLGFARSESVISLVLEKASLHGEHLTGLCGELLLMRSMMKRYPARVREIVESWHGHTRSSRDFQIDGVGVEVKTTSMPQSRHRIHGVRQVEIGHAVGGGLETALLLASIGITPADRSQGNAWSLPSLVEDILGAIKKSCSSAEGAALKARMVDSIRNYGGDAAGYDHDDLLHRSSYGHSYSTVFARFYDMADATIKVVRTADLAAFSVVDPQSIEFTIELPPQVHGAINPLNGLQTGVDRIAHLAWSS